MVTIIFDIASLCLDLQHLQEFFLSGGWFAVDSGRVWGGGCFLSVRLLILIKKFIAKWGVRGY